MGHRGDSRRGKRPGGGIRAGPDGSFVRRNQRILPGRRRRTLDGRDCRQPVWMGFVSSNLYRFNSSVITCDAFIANSPALRAVCVPYQRSESTGHVGNGRQNRVTHWPPLKSFGGRKLYIGTPPNPMDTNSWVNAYRYVIDYRGTRSYQMILSGRSSSAKPFPEFRGGRDRIAGSGLSGAVSFRAFLPITPRGFRPVLTDSPIRCGRYEGTYRRDEYGQPGTRAPQTTPNPGQGSRIAGV